MIIFTQEETTAINSDHVVAYGISKADRTTIIAMLDNGKTTILGSYKDEKTARTVLESVVASAAKSGIFHVSEDRTEVRDGTV